MWIKLTSGEDPKSWNYFVDKFTSGERVVPVFQRMYRTWKDIDLYLAALIEKVPTDVRGIRNQASLKLFLCWCALQAWRYRQSTPFKITTDILLMLGLQLLKSIDSISFWSLQV